jgi:hypothetical protein
MATSSTVPAVRSALVALLEVALPDSQVSYGRPADAALQRECVWVGAARGADRIPVMKAGRKCREQSYSVQVIVWVAMPSGQQDDADARAFEVLTVIEGLVADDPSLGGLDGLVHATAGAWESVSDFAKEGPFASISFDVDCLARIN